VVKQIIPTAENIQYCISTEYSKLHIRRIFNTAYSRIFNTAYPQNIQYCIFTNIPYCSTSGITTSGYTTSGDSGSFGNTTNPQTEVQYWSSTTKIYYTTFNYVV